jgi:hypothetical protein
LILSRLCAGRLWDSQRPCTAVNSLAFLPTVRSSKCPILAVHPSEKFGPVILFIYLFILAKFHTLAGDKKKAVAIHSSFSFRNLAILFFQEMTNSTIFL